MKLNHIGVAVNDIEETTHLLEFFGYSADEKIMWDENQKVNVRFLYNSNAPTIELLAGGAEPSPIEQILKKNGTSVYHLCFETKSIEDTVQELRRQHYLPIGEKKESVIGGRNVIFLYHPDNVMIELLEVG